MVYFGIFGIFWYILVHFGTFWYILVYFGILGIFGIFFSNLVHILRNTRPGGGQPKYIGDITRLDFYIGPSDNMLGPRAYEKGRCFCLRATRFPSGLA